MFVYSDLSPMKEFNLKKKLNWNNSNFIQKVFNVMILKIVFTC